MFSGKMSNVFVLLFRHRRLLWEMVRQDVLDRYSGHAFQLFWTVFQPIFVIGVQITVFTFLFRADTSGQAHFPFPYPVYILSGLIPWYYCQEAISRGCFSIVANGNMVKQVVFPVEIIPVKTTLSALFIQMIALGFLLVFLVVSSGKLPALIFLLPLVLLFQCFFITGISYFLAAITPYFHDVKEMVQMFLMTAVYLMPIIYLPTMVPRYFRGVLYLNPFSHMIYVFQDTLFFGQILHGWSWGIFAVESLVCLFVGFRVFKRLQVMFGNVL
jgi:lipopolysaccharide transport system permease protein